MTTADSKTRGIGVLEDMPWGTHCCHFYETDEELVAISVPYLKAGLDRDAFCMWMIAEPLTENDAWSALRRAIPDVDRHRADGNIEVLFSRDFYLKDGALDREQTIRGWKDRLARALDRGYRGMRVTGGTHWIPSEQWGDLCAYEKALNEVLLHQPITLLCTYSLAVTAGGQVFDVVRTHQFATSRRKGQWAVIETPVEPRVVERTRPAELDPADRVLTTNEMAASIAVEASHPLSAMLTNATTCRRTLAGDEPDLDEARAAVDRIIDDGRRAGEMIQQMHVLLTQSEPEKVRLDINDVIREAIALAETQMRRHGASARTELSPLPPVLGDRIQLQEVLVNLIMNGVEAMSAADTVVDVSRELVIASHRAGPETVLVEVRDSGVGFDPDSMPKLFDPFFTTKAGSMGMGLSISRSIVDAHGGRLWATPNADRGATLRFTLPIARDGSTNVGY